MFEERLRTINERIEGSLAASLVAEDGIPVESAGEVEGLDLEALAAEMMTQVRGIAKDHRELDFGSVRRYSISTDRYNLMLGALTSGYFLLLVLGQDGNMGRARFELRRAPLAFEEDLV